MKIKILLRNFFLIAGILHFIQYSQAQIRVGFIAGYNAPTYVNNHIYLRTVSHIQSLQAGLMGEMELRHHLFLNIGLSIITNGGNLDITDIDAGSYQTIRATYIQLPINVGIKFPLHNSFKLLAEGGFYAAEGIYGTQKGWYYSIAGATPVSNAVRFTNDDDDVDGKLHIHPFDVGYQFATGIEWKELQLRFQFVHGLENIFPMSFANTEHFRNQHLGFSFAYLFGLKKKKSK